MRNLGSKVKLSSIEMQNLNNLTLETAKTNPTECMKYMQQLTKTVQAVYEAEILQKYILVIIHNETGEKSDKKLPANQMLLNAAFRCYFELLAKFDLQNVDYNQLAVELLIRKNPEKESTFQILYAILMTAEKWNDLQIEGLETHCRQAFKTAVQENNQVLLAILRALNLIYKKFSNVNSRKPEITLDCIYYCLECTQIGMREETLILIAHFCRQPQPAFEYFQIVTEFWPWTNRNKYYMLNSILSSHNVIEFLCDAKQSIPDFFAGLRFSLSYKNLLSASQCLVTTLSQQDSSELLTLSVDILTRGSLTEIQNFYSHWLGHIKQKDILFELLQEQIEIIHFLKVAEKIIVADEVLRLVIIFSMFARQIFQASKLYFFKISTELITNCHTYCVDTQFFVFKFIADNLGSFAIEDSLEFILGFVRAHRCIENAQYRNNILGKMPAIINYISKSFNKVHHTTAATTLEESIVSFFHTLQVMIDEDIESDLYQKKIFVLKLFEILLNSLYAKKVRRNCKNCCLQQNEQLGLFLCERKVFNAFSIAEKLMAELRNPLGFDDASELIVALLVQLQVVTPDAASELCLQLCQRIDVDECALSTHFVKVALQGCESEAEALKLYEIIVPHLSGTKLENFRTDPLLVCQSGQHIFGYVSVLNEIVSFSKNAALLKENFQILLKSLADILNIILELLSLSQKQNHKDDNEKCLSTAANFQDMDESLEMIICASSCKTANHQESRKFLLMSFWLTLKACCDFATTIGCLLVRSSEHSEEDLHNLKACLDINVAVLTCCRHKGAIEAAGVSIGKLTKSITSLLPPTAKGYSLLYECVDHLFEDGKQVSTTRRGAGFSIMFLHVIKNEDNPTRPIYNRALQRILNCLKMAGKNTLIVNRNTRDNCDHMEALTLHYLCVLVKDTELRHVVAKSYSEIMLASIQQIDHTEWTICNAALQLFGAIVPKIVGQKHGSECDSWEVCDITYSEIMRKFPMICEYILNYCTMKCEISTATRSIILFLGFLAKVQYLRKSIDEHDSVDTSFVQRIRLLMWRLLHHNCDKVRKLAATCFVRAHEFRIELPRVLLQISEILFKIKNENFFHGLLCTLIEGFNKMQHESKYTMSATAFDSFKLTLQMHLISGFQLDKRFKFYTFRKLLDLVELIGVDSQTTIVTQLLQILENQAHAHSIRKY